MKPKSKVASRVTRTQLLIVGAGPVGLFAALCAARRGLDVMVLEQNFRGCARGHATILHPASLQLLGDLGLSHQLLAAGTLLRSLMLHRTGEPTLTIDFPRPALTVPQTVIEEILLKALRRETVQLKTCNKVTRIEQGTDSVQATVASQELVELGSPANFSEWQPTGSSLVDAQFVVGADGYESFVRAALNAENRHAGPTETFAMFEGPAGSDDSGMDLGFDSDLMCAICPLSDHRARWGFQLDSRLDLEPNLELLHKLLDERASWAGHRPELVDWSTVTHFERRFAVPFGHQRVWLAGDAAHVTSPFGGQSMNGGLLEAHHLVERMAECVFAHRPLDTLQLWGSDRAREWQQLLAAPAQVDNLAHVPQWLREHAGRIIPALPASGRDLQHLLRELGLSLS